MKICVNCQARFDQIDWQCPKCGYIPPRNNTVIEFGLDVEEGFQERYFAELAESEPGHFWFESRNRVLQWAMQQFFPEARSFLEVGCGTGFVLQGFRSEFPDLDLSGSEIFSEGLKYAAQRVPEATLYHMDARHIPFEDEFDVIGCFDVLEHIKEDGVALEQMCRAITPGGGLLITVPQHRFLWSIADEVSQHQRRYTRAELVTKLEAVGLSVYHTTSFVSLLLPLMVAARWRAPKEIDKYDDMAEFNISPLVNRSLRGVLAIEAAFIKRKISLPMGGSLLAIAGKQ